MSTEIFKIVRANLVRLRKAKSWSQHALAEQMKIPHSHYHRIESGKVEPTISSLQKAADSLEVDLVRLLEPFDSTKLSIESRLKKLQSLPEEERKAIDLIITLALEKHRLADDL